MKNLKCYSTIDDYGLSKSNLKYPTVSHILDNNQIYYINKEEKRIIVYKTSQPLEDIKLFARQEYLEYAKLLENDEILTVTGNGALNYTFADAGEHEVEVKFKDELLTLDSAFHSCFGLVRVCESLFNNCKDVTSFNDTFAYCIGLTDISNKLFYNNKKAETFVSSFQNCFSLSSIPENLFSNNLLVKQFYGVFSYCSGLTNIPEKLFINNTKVLDFQSSFQGCSGLTGTVPVDSDETPIYNRSGEGKPGYDIVTKYEDCFKDCIGLSDYSSIPSDWGGIS